MIRAGDTVFDVGANQGNYTVLFSHIVGASGQVHAFEPVPDTYHKLSKTIEAKARHDNTSLNNSALTEASGTSTIYLPGQDHGQASLRRHKAGSWLNQESISHYEVKTTSLDIYVRSHSITQVDFLKIDTEGAELLVLRGGSEMIAQNRPILYLEVFDEWFRDFEYSGGDLIQFLQSLGYEKFFAVGDGINLLNNSAISLSLAKQMPCVNLLCTGADCPRVGALLNELVIHY